MPLIRLRVGTRRLGQCAAAICRAPIDWYRTLEDRAMPMNRGAQAHRIEHTGDDDIGYFDSGDTHWSTCPARKRFVRRPPGTRRPPGARQR
jgi:hypothetical protein